MIDVNRKQLSVIQPDYIEKIALFYYFCFLDETKAQNFTVQTLKMIRSRKVKTAKFSPIDIVAITDECLRKLSDKIKPINLAFSADYIQLPKNSNWGPWFELRKLANESDTRALLYSWVLRFSEEEIAEGLKLPLGTVRYRIGNGLKVLGRICLSESTS